jgi:PilZ domain-containing protein
MSKKSKYPQPQDERRRFERVHVEHRTPLYVNDGKGARVGDVRQLGRGGFQLESDWKFEVNKSYRFSLIDDKEKIHCPVHAVLRYVDKGLAGFEFQDLDADSAVKIGILIGRYYMPDSESYDAKKLAKD